MKITFLADGPTVNAGPAQSACANNPTLTLAGSYTVATGIVWSGGAGTYVPNNTTKNATYTPTAAEIAAGSVTLTLTTTGNGGTCPAVTSTVTLTYTPAPTVNAGTAPAICANNAVAALSGTSTNSTGVFWSGGTGTFSAGTSLNTNYTPSAAEINAAPSGVTLTLTATKAGCTPVTSSVTVSITAKPAVNAGSSVTICKNDSANLAGTVTVATGGTWSGGTGKFSPNANTLNANYKPGAADLAAGSVTLTLTTTGNGNCTPVSSTMKISFAAAPTISVTAPASVCQNNPVITLSDTKTNATGQTWQGSGGTFVPGTSAASVQYTPTPAEIANGATALVVSTTGTNGTGQTCPPVYDTVIVNINPAPTVSAGAPVSVCANNPTGTLHGTVSGIPTITWSSPTGGLFSNPTNPVSGYTATAADIAAGSVVLTATASKAGCNPVSSSVTFTITSAPTVSAGPARSVCANNPTAAFNGTFSGAAGVTWTGGSGTFSAPTSAATSYTAGASDITAGKVILTLTTTGNGNCLAVSSTDTLYITPKPVVSAGGPYTVCANNPATSLSGTVSAAATGGTWSGGAGSFAPGTNVLNPVYTPTAAETAAGSITLTLTSTGNGNCNPVSASALITFTPAPSLTPVTPVTVCADFPAANVSTTKTVATGVLWSGGTGTIANPTALSTTYTPSLAEVTAGKASLTITTTGNGTCSPVTAPVSIIINPAPTISAGASQTVCGTTATVSNLTGTVTAATGGKWTNTNGTGTIASPNSLNTTYTPSTSDITSGSVTLTLTSTGNGLCQPVSASMTITYTPEPSINAGPNQVVCSTELPVNLAASGSPAVWNTSGGTFGNVNSPVTTYIPSAAETAAGSVTLSISTIPGGACPAKTASVLITIPAGPAANPGAASQTMCGSLASFQLNGTVSNASGGFWSSGGTGSFLPNANTLNAQYVPSATDRTAGSVTLTLTTTGNGTCLPQSQSTTLTITPAIAVSAGPDQTLCADAAGITLNGTVSNAGGALWTIVTGSGTLANASNPATVYTPSPADTARGTVSLSLTSTGNAGCPAVSSSVTFTLTPAPTLTIGANQTICADSAYVQLSATTTVASAVNWTSSGTGTFAPDNVSLNSRYIPSAADKTAGSISITATTTGNGTCHAIAKSITVTITPAVTLTVASTQNVCENNSAVNLNAALTVATVVNWTSSGTGTFASQTSPATTYTPSVTDMNSGTVTLTVKSVNNGTCKPQSRQVVVSIAPAPLVNAGLPQTVCANTAGVNLNGTLANAGGAQWTSAGSGSFANPNTPVTGYIPSPADTSAGSVTLTLTSTANGTCNPVSSQVIITLQKLPVVAAGPGQTICADSSYVQLAGMVANAGGGTWTSSGSGIFSSSTIMLNAAYTPTTADRKAGIVSLTLTSTSNGTCPPVSSSLNITITTAPAITVGPDQTVCANNANTSLNASYTIASGAIWSTSGTGSFAPDKTATSVTYTPSAIDIAAGSVVLGMTTTGNGTCKPASDYMTLIISPAPVISAGANKSICGDSLGVPLDNASFSNAAGVSWSTSGSGVFGASASIIQPTYYPSAADKTAGTVTLSVVTTGNGVCRAASSSMTMSITPVPTVNAGSSMTACADTGGVVLSGTFTIAGGVQWTSSGSGVFTPSASLPAATYVPSPADTAARTVNLTLTTTSNGTCKAVSSSTSLNLIPVPVVNAGSNEIICIVDENPIPLNGSVKNASGGIWTTTGSGSFIPGNTTLNALYNASPADSSAGSVTLTLSSTGSGLCKARSSNVTLTFSPVPSISAGNNLQVCNTVSSISVNGSESNVSSVSWSIVQGNGSLTSPNSLNTTYNVGPGDVASSVILMISGTVTNGCRDVNDQMTISFVALPPINAGPNATVCVTDFPIQLQASGSTAQWSNYTGTFSPNDQTLNALYTPSAAEVSAGSVTLDLTTTNNGLCPPNTSQVTYTLVPGPVVSTGTVPSICSNTPSISLSGTSNGVSTGVQWISSGSGTFSNATSLNTTYTPSPSDITGGSIVLAISSTGNGVCTAASGSAVLVIQPQPAITVGNAQTICGDAAFVSLNASFTNAFGVQWSAVSGSGTFSNPNGNSTQYNISSADTAAGSVILQAAVTGQNLACAAATANVPVTFTKIPAANAGPPITVCADTASIPLSGSVSRATGGTWSSATGGFFAPSKTSLNTAYIPSAADRAAGTATVTLTTTGNGTCRAYSASTTITIKPFPTITATAARDTICANATVINTITLSASGSNAPGFQWMTTGSGTFSVSNASPAVYTPSADDISNGGVILYASTTGAAPCNNVQSYVPVTILNSPQAVVNAGRDQTACAGAGFFQLNGTVSGVATGGVWTSSSGLGTFYPNNTNLTPVFVPDQSDVNAGGLTLFLTSTGNGICGASTGHMKLTLVPVPLDTAGGAAGNNQSFCRDTAFIQLNPVIIGAAGGLWSTGGTGYFSPSAAVENAVYVPSAADRTSGDVGLTLTTTGNGVCFPISDYLNIKLTPAPAINIGPDQTVCANTGVNLSAAVTIATSVNWTSSGSGIVVPNNSLTSTYIPSAADTASKVLNIFAETLNQGACKPAFDTMKVTLQPVPIVVPISSADNICADTAYINVSAAVFNAAGISWTTNGTGSFTPNSSGNNVTYNLSAADKNKTAVTLYPASANSGACASVKDSIKISIAPVPVVSAGSPVICDTINGAALSGSVLNAAGGVWTSSSGKGAFSASNNTLNAAFFPAHADIAAGSVKLILTSTGNGLCKPVSSSTNLLIIPSPVANAGPDQYVCANSSTTVKAQTIQTGVGYSWQNSAGATVAPANSPDYTLTVPATTSLVLNAKDSRGCLSTDTININAFTLPALSMTPNPACEQMNLLVSSLTAGGSSLPYINQWYDNGIIMTGQNKSFIIVSDTGTFKISYAYGNCSVTAQTTVRPVPVVTASDIIACGKGILTASASGNAALAWNLNGVPVAGNPITINSVPNDTVKYYVKASYPTGCAVTDSAYVIGLPVPLMKAIDTTSCQGMQVHLSALPDNIAYIRNLLPVTFKWQLNGGASFSADSTVNVSALGTYTGTVTMGQCSGTSPNTVAFAAYPVSNLNHTNKYCNDDSLTNPVILYPGFQPNTTYKWSTGATSDSIEVTPDVNTTYYVTITNKSHCSIRDSAVVRVICPPRMDVPNAFLPGRTGTQDQYFRGFGPPAYIQSYKMTVFNRWGEVIFISNDLMTGWDGTYRGEPMPSGVYPWELNYEGYDEYRGPYKKAGSVAIIR